jgi:hypothetical protein
MNPVTLCLLLTTSQTPPVDKAVSRPPFDLKIKETVIGTMPTTGQIDEIHLSPDGRRFAYLLQFAESVNTLLIDGEPVLDYEWIDQRSFQFSPDGKRTVFVGFRAGRWYCVIDGKASQPYDYVRRVQFSPDSRRVVFHAQRDKKHFVVENGIEGPAYSNLSHMFWFSPDSRRLAYTAVEENREILVVDGVKYPAAGSCDITTLEFSPDSNHWLCVASYRTEPSSSRRDARDGGAFDVAALLRNWVYYLVVDGKPLQAHDRVDAAQFSPDSRHILYRAGDGESERVFVDGKPGRPYRSIRAFFHPDGRVIGIAERGAKQFLVIDGVEQRPYDAVSGLSFGDSGKRMAYAVVIGNERSIVVDGKKHKQPDGFMLTAISFSPDGRHFAYSVSLAKKDTVVIDDAPYPMEGGEMDLAFGLHFTPNSRHTIYVNEHLTQGPPLSSLMVDGRAGPTYEWIQPYLTEGKLPFLGSSKFWFSARREGRMYRVEVEIVDK